MNILQAAEHLKKGGVVAFPTETVYGLGASIYQEEGISSIFSLKKRAKDNPLIVHIHDLNQVFLLARNVPETFFLLAKAFFPGPLTIILPKNTSISDSVTASLDSVAIRMPKHPVAIELLKEVNEPIAAPSANLSGKPSPTALRHVEKDFKGKVPILEGGECEIGIESTVISLIDVPTILRPGSITKEQIEQVLGVKIQIGAKSAKALCPGMKYRHYAPDAKVHLLETLDNLTLEKEDLLLSNLSKAPLAIPYDKKNIYTIFHQANEKNIKNIYIHIDSTTKKDLGLMNRIEKSANRF